METNREQRSCLFGCILQGDTPRRRQRRSRAPLACLELAGRSVPDSGNLPRQGHAGRITAHRLLGFFCQLPGACRFQRCPKGAKPAKTHDDRAKNRGRRAKGSGIRPGGEKKARGATGPGRAQKSRSGSGATPGTGSGQAHGSPSALRTDSGSAICTGSYTASGSASTTCSGTARGSDTALSTGSGTDSASASAPTPCSGTGGA